MPCQASLRATLSKKIQNCGQVYISAICRSEVGPSQPHHVLLPPPNAHPGADRWARPPSGLQQWESDNIRSILYPVTHSPRPTGKWKRLLEAVKGEWKQKEWAGSQWTSHSASVCVRVRVSSAPTQMHRRDSWENRALYTRVSLD